MLNRKLVIMSIIAISGDVLVETAPYTLGDGYHSTVTFNRGFADFSLSNLDGEDDIFVSEAFEGDFISSDYPVFATHQSSDGLVVIDLFSSGLPLVGAFSGILTDDLNRLEGDVLRSITSSDSVLTTSSISPYFEVVGSETVVVPFNGSDVKVIRSTYRMVQPLPKELFYAELGYALAEALID